MRVRIVYLSRYLPRSASPELTKIRSALISTEDPDRPRRPPTAVAPRCGLAPPLGLWVVVAVREPPSAPRPFSPSPQPSRTRDHDPGASRPNIRSGKATPTTWRSWTSSG